MGNKRTKKSISLEGFVFLAIFLGIFGGMGMKMGGVNMLNTLMNTGYQLLLETVFYIMAIAVLAGAISGLFSEFGVISMVNKLLSPLMKPLKSAGCRSTRCNHYLSVRQSGNPGTC